MRLYQKRHPRQETDMFFINPKDNGWCVSHGGKILASGGTIDEMETAIAAVPKPYKNCTRLIFIDDLPPDEMLDSKAE